MRHPCEKTILRCALLAGLTLGSMAACSASDPSGGDGSGQDSSTGDGSVIDDVIPDGGSPEEPAWQYRSPDGTLAYKDPELPENVGEQFGGSASADGAPNIVYPLADSMHPMNLLDVTLQWQRGAETSKVFRIELVSGGTKFHMYLPCQSPGANKSECVYRVPQSEWKDLGQRFKGSDLSLVATGTDGVGGSVSTSSTVKIHFSPMPVIGGLYYWDARSQGIKRATFGSARAVPFITPSSDATDFKCVACHSVSRDGKVIAFAVTDEEFAAKGIQTAPIDNPVAAYVRPTRGTSPAGVEYPREPGRSEAQDYFGDNVGLSPDGSIAALNGAVFNMPPNDKYFELRDTTTGATIERWPAWHELFGGKLPIHPEWSPDGTKIAVTLAEPHGNCQWTFFSCKSVIAILPYDKATRTIGAPIAVTAPASGMMDFYPTWSPNGDWLAFVSAPMPPIKQDGEGDPAIGSSSGNKQGVLRLVRATGGPHACPSTNCFELTRGTGYTLAEATGEASMASTWPKFTPFAQGSSGNILFVSFTTRRDYGFLARGATQLWMFAVDTAASGTDPSYAPLWIPYQETTDESLTPYWTEVLPCSSDADGGCKGCVGGEQCVVDSTNNSCSCESVVR